MALPTQERTVLEGAASSIRAYPAGHVLVRQNEKVNVSILLAQGIMTRHIDDIHGRRHLVTVHVPRDFVDLHGDITKRPGHEVAALTEVNVATFIRAELERIHANQTPLSKQLWFCTLLNTAMHRQWICRHAGLQRLQRGPLRLQGELTRTQVKLDIHDMRSLEPSSFSS